MGTPKNALATLNRGERYIDHASLIHRGCWHNQRGRVLKVLKEYDRAVIEYAGAAVYFEQAGDQSLAAMSLNNEAAVYIQWGKYDEAHKSVKKAVAVYTALDDPFLPHAQDHEAQILIAKGFPGKAKELIDRVIASVEQGDKKELLLECLLTRARALVEMGFPVETLADIERAGQLGEYLSRPDLRLLVAKVRKEVTGKIAIQSHLEMVQLALEQSGGAVRVAAQKLGLNHASLIAFIKTHKLDRKNPRKKTVMTSSAKT